MLTDETMDQIEMETGVPKTQQRITHQSKQMTTRQTLNHYSIQESDTIETGTTDPTEQPVMDTEESATHNDVQIIEREPIKRRASEDGVDVPEPADVSRATQKRRGKTGKAESRQNRGNARRHLVYDATRKQRAHRERRSKGRRKHERT